MEKPKFKTYKVTKGCFLVETVAIKTEPKDDETYLLCIHITRFCPQV